MDIGLPGVEGEHTRFGFGGGVGYHFTDYFRSDINLAYVSYDDYTFASPFGDVKFRTRTGPRSRTSISISERLPASRPMSASARVR